MNNCQMKSSLDDPERWLVEAMSKLRFGRVEGLHVKDKRPLRYPAPMFVRSRKFTKNEGTRTAEERDFALKAQVSWLISEIAEVGDGIIRSVTVQDGLPVLVDWESRTEL
ncbi:MAG: hypothetical protein ABFD46_08345 [Armatimonadota bacterium]